MPNKPTTLREFRDTNKKYDELFDNVPPDCDEYSFRRGVNDTIAFFTSHSTELVSKIEGMRKELWLDYHNAQKWSEQKAVAEALDQVISLINQEK